LRIIRYKVLVEKSSTNKKLIGCPSQMDIDQTLLERKKMKKILVPILFLFLILASVTPAAADQKIPVGTRINLHNPPATFTAGAPFYITHGFLFYVGQGSVSDQNMRGVYDFKLEVDGVYQKAAFVDRTLNTSNDPLTLNDLEVFNFPNGLTAGEHTFSGHWFAPCGKDCKNPTTPVEINVTSVTVEFTP